MRRFLEACIRAIHAFRLSLEHDRGRRKHVCSYHDLHVTTDTIPRTRLTDLPGQLMVTCTRAGGWTLWLCGASKDKRLAGEYCEPGLRLDVGGAVIVDSLKGSKQHGAEENIENGRKESEAPSREAAYEHAVATLGLPPAKPRYEEFYPSTAAAPTVGSGQSGPTEVE